MIMIVIVIVIVIVIIFIHKKNILQILAANRRQRPNLGPNLGPNQSPNQTYLVRTFINKLYFPSRSSIALVMYIYINIYEDL